MRTKFVTAGFLTAIMIGVLSVGGGCNSDVGVCQQNVCEANEQLWACKPTTGWKQYNCLDGQTAADFWCQSIAGKSAKLVPCENYGDGGDTDGGSDTETGGEAPAWDPSSSVTYDRASGKYLVDEAFVTMLRADPGLILLDSARVDMSPTGGYYVLESVAQGDLADVMGLQSGDMLISVNRYSLASIDSMIDAWYALEYASSFTLAISRNGQTQYLSYQIVQ